VQYEWYYELRTVIYNFLASIRDMLLPILPFGPIAYGFIFYTIFWIIIVLLVRRRYKEESYYQP
jgi:hypothetical protein